MDKNSWRLIVTSIPSTGAWNMALDEALLRSAAEKKSPPTLRLYCWQPATLSLGFAQTAADVDLETLKKEGWGLVRRPTGGRAILHVDEVTYSVTAPVDEPLLTGDLLETYRKISQALLTGLTSLRVAAVGDKTYENGSARNFKNPVCFETPSNYEITTDGRKLIGSAQARKYGGILQHGTLPIHGDITRVTRALKFNSPEDRAAAASKLSQRATTIENILNFIPDWMNVANAIIKGFVESFGISFIENHPNAIELENANTLMNEKYLSNAWTFRL